VIRRIEANFGSVQSETWKRNYLPGPTKGEYICKGQVLEKGQEWGREEDGETLMRILPGFGEVIRLSK
jgi:hypothetical protein